MAFIAIILLKPLSSQFSRLGYDSKILRFGAYLVENRDVSDGRKFIISYYLLDDTVSVYEIPIANSGNLIYIYALKLSK